jgi:hypothetical protein
MKKRILIMTALLAGVWSGSASITVEGWWHFGEISDYYADSSGNGHRFGEAFSSVGSGNAGAGVEPFGCGGPLGDTGFISTNCLYWTPSGANAAGMWDPGFNPPVNNYVIELWCLPEYPGSRGGNGAWLFCSGSSGGVTFDLTNDGNGNMAIAAEVVPTSGGIQIGDPLAVNTNQWTHLAIVNTDGTNTFYVDGVQHGAPSSPSVNTVPAGDIYAGSAPGTTPTYVGYLDELRISTFVSGQFSVTDLLTRAMSPDILSQPQSTTVWNGGAVPFTVGLAFDSTTTYQWQRGGANIAGAVQSEYYLNTVATSDSGAQFDVVLNNSSKVANVTSSLATLTVAPVQSANVAYYRSAVQAESGLVAYYTVDNDTGATLTDTKGSNNGTLEGTAEFDGRTNYAYGVRSLRLKNSADGDVTIPNNAAFEFAKGSGTIEAIVHLDQALTLGNETIFSEAGDGGSPLYYEIQASDDGTALIYNNDALTNAITWAVPVSLLGRLAHVAVVFTNNTVTAYVDGLSLGTKANPSFGSTVGLPLYVGSTSLDASGGMWCGSIDELAIYTSALPANTIAIHNSRFLYGTNVSVPTITSQPGAISKTLLAGGSPVFTVAASGTAPLTYQWYMNSSAIPNATAPTLTLTRTTTNSSGSYYLQISNPIGSTNSQAFTLTFVSPADPYAKIVMGDNPLAYWRLAETNGATAFDSAGAHDGAYSGSLTLGGSAPQSGVSHPAVHFAGGNAEVPYSATLNPSTAFTVEFWANPDNEPSATYVPLCSQYRNGSVRDGWAFYDENDASSWELQLGGPNGIGHYAYGGGPEPFGGQWYYVVAIWDGTNTLTVYADNELVGQNTQIANGGVFVPNPSAPWWIGVRADGNYAFDGAIDEVAMYNYAFTTQQVSNHWSIVYKPSAIVTEPVGATNVAGSTITLTAVVSGFPNTYQWFQGSVALTDTANSDGTPHYPQDVTNATLVISQVQSADSGQYHLVVSNPLPGGGSVSSSATVLVTADTNPPVVTTVKALGTPNAGGPTPFLVQVTFDKRVDPFTGGTTANYAINGGVTINQVVLRGDVQAEALGTDWKNVFLQTSGLTPGKTYTVTVSGILDQAQVPNKIVPATISFVAPPLTQGALQWDYYYEITPQSVYNLENFQYFPYAPTTNWYVTVFDTHQITGGELDDTSWGSLGDYYGDSVSGWITPTVTGDYTFFLASDDASELDLSPDNTLANAVAIATEAGCCHGFLEPGATVTQTSTPQHLVANTPYFIRTLHTQGTGGDYVMVAWRASTDSTPAVDLKPIPSQYLSAYVLLPAKFNPPVFSNGQLTISWTGQGTLYESDDLKTWTAVAGNPTSPFQVTPNPAKPRHFYLLEQ